jgi:Ser/Thr protein kinase RdoA (MazF antagonist)
MPSVSLQTVPFADQALTLYDLPKSASATLFSRSENEIYRVQGPGGHQWALRIQRPGYQSTRSLVSEIAWLVALRADGVVATPVPIAGINGEWVQTVRSPFAPEVRNVVLFAWEKGAEPRVQQDLRPSLKCLGAIAAQMHAHSEKWTRPQGFERFTWDFETTLGETPRWGRWTDGLGMDAARRDLFGKTAALIRERLKNYGAGPSRFGLVHGDLRPANLLLHQRELKIIDFDDCGFSWYMYDIATVVSFYEHLPEVPAMLERLLEGYKTVRPLSRADEEEISTFVMLRRLLLVAWVGSHADTDLARSLGIPYTEQTVALCASYLECFG